jgi:dephospho-CoA kinase
MKNNVYLITGPIGSGKSSALELISSLDLFTVDLDKVSNNILNQTESFNFIKNNFPDAIENNKILKQSISKYKI